MPSKSDYRKMIPVMKRAHKEILQSLERAGLPVEPYPELTKAGRPAGEAAALAYPIQGILKYHGMWNWDLRTAYLPSISVNNDAAYTITLVRFDPALDRDVVSINAAPATGRAYQRVVSSLDAVRSMAQIESPAQVVSRNVVRASRVGKGLGTSASASAALAMAAIAAAWGPELTRNRRFLSCMARLLAGSGCRSATGGVSLWLSYPGVAHEDSFAVRLDNANQLADLRLLTVPIDSRIGLKTERAHRDAPHSPFYKAWMHNRRAEVIECIESVQAGEWLPLARLAELDSIRLHGITMSGSRENKIFAWEPENIALFRLCNDLRSRGVPVYFSTDTGPTTVFFTISAHQQQVREAIQGLGMGFEVISGGIAPEARLLDPGQAQELLASDS